MSKEKKFYKVLQDLFIGAKIEGTGGFINLMKIKSKYYEKIEELLQNDIKKALEKYPDFRDELYDKLYSFFNRYFTESGSIYFKSTAFHNNVYEKIYTNDKDVILFWKTQMLYYVKTDKIFRNLEVKVDNYNFFFNASTIENKKANEKRSLIYEFAGIDDGKIIFNVKYSEKGQKTKIDEIRKELNKNNLKITEEQLEKVFRIFEKQSEVDFFINKNAKAFLQEQFKLWSYQYFWEGGKEWTADRVNQLQILKDIAFKIIDFVSQFEDELVKIWNKPKFVKNSNYVITLDKIGKFELIEKIVKHKNIEDQIEEWKEFEIVDKNFKVEDIFDNDLTGKHLAEKYKHLPIDTKYFKDLELEILSLFDDLDKSLDGWLIKSENYQALNTMLPKFKEKVQTIYIDPPFNLDSSDQFLYRTNYKDANWATLLENRLRIAKDWLNEKGSIFVRCDYNGNWIVRCLLDDVFGKENFRNELVVKRIKKQTFEEPKSFAVDYDNIYFYSKNFEVKVIINPPKIEISRTEEELWHSSDTQGKHEPRVFFGKELYPPQGRGWFSQEKIDELISKKELRLVCKRCKYKHYEGFLNDKHCSYCNENDWRVEYKIKRKDFSIIGNLWNDISGYTHNWQFPTENSEILLKRVIESTSNKDDLVIDFFLGSGTTTAVAHKLCRKWIGIEMGEHFYTVVLPRMKKVLAYDKSGISKEVKEYKGGGFFKYYELEQYEETLANTIYENHDIIIVKNKNPYEQYVFMKDEKMLKALEIDYQNNKVKVDLSKLYENIDIAETLSNITGKKIKRIKEDEVEFEDGIKVNIKDLDYKLIKHLIWWE